MEQALLYKKRYEKPAYFSKRLKNWEGGPGGRAVPFLLAGFGGGAPTKSSMSNPYNEGVLNGYKKRMKTDIFVA
ncbi:MAG: hypothetical protein H7833_08095 [Magnetococcus sp. DMHC-1]